MAAAGPRPRAGPERWGVPGAVPPLRVDEPPPGDPEGGPDRVRGALVPGAPGVNAARVTARAWTLGLRDALAELADVRLRWCLLCARVGLWGWQPLTPSDRKSTRLNSSHVRISYAVFCLKKKK